MAFRVQRKLNPLLLNTGIPLDHEPGALDGINAALVLWQDCYPPEGHKFADEAREACAYLQKLYPSETYRTIATEE